MGFMADDCSNNEATNCGITISGNQTIDIGSSISTTDKRGVQITGDSNMLTIDGDITVNSSVMWRVTSWISQMRFIPYRVPSV